MRRHMVSASTRGHVKAFYEKQLAAVEEYLTAFERNRVVTEPNALRYSFLIKNRTYVFLNGQKIFSYGKKTNMADFAHDRVKEGIYIPGRHEGVAMVAGLSVGFEVCLEHSLGILILDR